MRETWEEPGSAEEALRVELAREIILHGWAVQGVAGSAATPPWAHTVGLTVHEQPELLITGMPLETAGDLLDTMAEHLLHAEAPRPGERMRLPGGVLVEFVAVEHPDVHLRSAHAFYQRALRGLQLVWADEHDRFPWRREFRGGRGGQPVLGRRAEGHGTEW